MSRYGVIVLSVLLSSLLAVVGCGSSGGGEQVDLVDLLPASGQISGWQEDTSRGEAGPEVTSDLAEATMWVDGAMDTFTATGGWVALAQEFYVNGEITIDLHIFEMSDADKASAVYDALADYSGISWTDESYGGGEAKGRFGCTAPFYCGADAQKGKYFIETNTKPATAESEAKALMSAVLQQIP